MPTKKEKKMGIIKFTDDMVFYTDGPYRAVHRKDGWYVVGHGTMFAVETEEEANTYIKETEEKKMEKRTKKEAKEYRDALMTEINIARIELGLETLDEAEMRKWKTPRLENVHDHTVHNLGETVMGRKVVKKDEPVPEPEPIPEPEPVEESNKKHSQTFKLMAYIIDLWDNGSKLNSETVNVILETLNAADKGLSKNTVSAWVRDMRTILGYLELSGRIRREP